MPTDARKDVAERIAERLDREDYLGCGSDDCLAEVATLIRAELSAHEQSIRAAALEDAARIAEDEKVDAASTMREDDFAYNSACDHIAESIRRALGKGKDAV